MKVRHWIILPVALVLIYALPYLWFWNPGTPICSDGPAREATLTQSQLNDLEAFFDNEGLIGLQFAMIDTSGQLTYAELGHATKDQDCPLTEQHLLYVGSVSKLLTSVAVWQAIDDEKLALDGRVSAIIELQDLPANLTVYELLHHTSGAVELTKSAWFLARLLQPLYRFDTAEVAKASDWFASERRGTHHYANSNYMLLGRLLEQTYDQDYETVLQQALSQVVPDLRIHWMKRQDADPIPRGYDRDVLPWPGLADTTPFRRPYESGGFAAAGVLSDAQSMARLVDGLFSTNRATINAEMRAYLFDAVPAQENDAPALFAYGAGVRFWTLNGETWVGHTGTQTGYSGLAFHNLDRNISIAAFANLSTFDQHKLLEIVAGFAN